LKTLLFVVAGLAFLQYWYSNYVALHRLPHFRPPPEIPTPNPLQLSTTLDVQQQNNSVVEKCNNELASEEKHQPKELQVRILNLDGALLYQTELIGQTLQ
jgi:hypothetical protein